MVERPLILNEKKTRSRSLLPGWFASSGLAVGAFWGGLHLSDSREPELEPRISALRHIDGDSIAPVPSPGLLERVRMGDDAAKEQLREKEPETRSIEEVLALSYAGEAEAQAAAVKQIERFRAWLKKREVSPQELADILASAGEPRTYRVILKGLAEMKDPLASDLLYESTRRYRHREEIVELARELLQTFDVHLQASPALSIVIDSWSISSCDEARELFDRAYQEADSRAVRHLAKFAERRGCGEHRSEDCYPCLRSNHIVRDALRKAQDRPARKFF